MPDHFHGIIFILGDTNETIIAAKPEAENKQPKIKSLGQLVGAFKTISTKQINQFRNTPGEVVWQRNYYDRIIRSEFELNSIRNYIQMNPLRWPKEF